MGVTIVTYRSKETGIDVVWEVLSFLCDHRPMNGKHVIIGTPSETYGEFRERLAREEARLQEKERMLDARGAELDRQAQTIDRQVRMLRSKQRTVAAKQVTRQVPASFTPPPGTLLQQKIAILAAQAAAEIADVVRAAISAEIDRIATTPSDRSAKTRRRKIIR